MGMQMRPRPCFAMKLIASGVTFSAASVRSPSFSRSSSSHDDDHLAGAESPRSRPRCGANGPGLLRRPWQCVRAVSKSYLPSRQSAAPTRGRTYLPTMSHSRLTRSPVPQLRQVRVRPGERNNLHIERSSFEPGDGQADAVDRNRPCDDQIRRERRRDSRPSATRIRLRRAWPRCPGRRRRAQHQVAAEPAVGAHRALEVHGRAALQSRQDS